MASASIPRPVSGRTIGLVVIAMLVAVSVAYAIALRFTRYRSLQTMRDELDDYMQRRARSSRRAREHASGIGDSFASDVLRGEINKQSLRRGVDSAKQDVEQALRIIDRALDQIGTGDDEHDALAAHLLGRTSELRVAVEQIRYNVEKVKEDLRERARKLAEQEAADEAARKLAEGEDESRDDDDDSAEAGVGGGDFFHGRELESGRQRGGALESGSANDSIANAGGTKLVMQADGNLVLYNQSGSPLWASGTSNRGTGPYKAIIQTDGNFVLYDSQNAALWHSETYGKGHAPYRVVLNNDNNVVVYDADELPLWATNTSGK